MLFTLGVVVAKTGSSLLEYSRSVTITTNTYSDDHGHKADHFANLIGEMKCASFLCYYKSKGVIVIIMTTLSEM
jgi:hypothetical protein